MSIRSAALAAGILGGSTMFILAWWLILIGNAEGPPTLFERIYIGYSFTPLGSVIGAVWGFIDWGIAGAIFAWLYNCINKKSWKIISKKVKFYLTIRSFTYIIFFGCNNPYFVRNFELILNIDVNFIKLKFDQSVLMNHINSTLS